MNPFEMVVLIVAIVMIAGVAKARYRCRSDDETIDRSDDAGRAETERLRAEVHALKMRVATLERIVTDGSTRLEHEIEALRDRP